MKLVRQRVLRRKEGKIDHIYEIDLCEVARNKYVINFRSGKPGGRLQEGTKTVFPVYHSVAEKIFNDLVESKLKEGYTTGDGQKIVEIAREEKSEGKLSNANRARKEAILNHLKRASQGEEVKGKWKLSRIIWRAGEMKLTEAVPHLIRLAGQGDDMQQYSLVWALGRCVAPETLQSVLQVLFHYYGNDSHPEKVRRIATAALCCLQKDKADDTFLQSLLDTLPSGLQELIRGNDPEGLAQKIQEYLFELKTTSNDYLTTLYHLSWKYPQIHATLAEILTELPLKPNYFQQIRHIFKAAEFREDGEIYGLLAYRFEKTAAYYTSRGYWRRYCYTQDGEYIKNRNEEIKKEQPRIAYSHKTREYFRNRIIRTLRRAGELQGSSYPELATGILLQFNDAVDSAKPYKTTFYRYAYRPFRRIEHHIHYDSYAKYHIFNFMLYTNSPRYELKKGAEAWNCVSPYEPGQPATDVREEAFPELWNRAPQCLLKLLLNSHCQRVHEFAVKAFRDVPDYASLVSIEQIISMLGFPYAVTNELALELAKQHYSAVHPNKELVRALVTCLYHPARAAAMQWIEESRIFFSDDSNFVCDLIFSPYPDVRQWTRTLLPTYTFSEFQEKAIITRTISALLALAKEEIEEELIRDVGEILLLTFPGKIYKIGLEVIRDLLQHPSLEMQALAGKILLKHATAAKDLPEDLFLALLQATAPQIRALGVQLLGQLPDDVLFTREQMLASFCISELPEIRNAVRPIMKRLAATRKAFGDKLVKQLATVFLFKESYEGLHQDLYDLFTESFSESLDVIEHTTAWKLLNSKYLQANRLGRYLLNTTLNINTFTMRQIVKLSRSELHELREAAWNFYRRTPERIKQEQEEALRIVDADWDDTRNFAFEYFRTTFTEDDWTPDLLVSLCDSGRADVQAFGRAMITRFFDETHGADYLLKLSQHPSADLQLFATNYLEGFATDNLERFQKLEPYFITILSQVNKGRVAKDRILHFLRTEAMKDEDTAQIAVRILTRQSLTLAIGDKATCIETLRDIQKIYPAIETPIAIKDVPVYENKD